MVIYFPINCKYFKEFDRCKHPYRKVEFLDSLVDSRCVKRFIRFGDEPCVDIVKINENFGDYML